MDGWLTIGTKIDDSGFDKQLQGLEKKYANKEVDIGVTSKELNDAESKLNDINEKLDNRIAREKEIKANLDKENKKQYKSRSLITMYKEQLASVTEEQLKLYGDWEKQSLIVEKTEGKLAKQKNDLAEIGSKLKEIKNQRIQESVENIGKGLNGVVKSVIRWGLAIFSIRSAYMLVRNAINTISQDDEQLKADIDYMKRALIYTLEPVVRKIVEWAKLLVFYFGYLIKAWTGHDIFASANKSLQKSVGSAKELKKTLAGFDEMNVISDTSGGTGAGASATPSFAFEDMEPPKWLLTIEAVGKWIIDNWEDVVGVLLLTKLFIDILTGNWLGVIIDLVLLLIDLFFKFKDAIGEIAENWKEAFSKVATFMKDKVITPIGNWFSSLWQKIKDNVKSAVDGIKEKFNSIKEFFRNLIDTIIGFFKNIGTKVGDAIGGAFKAVVNGVLSAIEKILNFPIKQVNNLLDVINAVPGINISKLSTFNLPRLAKGGIVNMPSRGVPIGGAMAGERGAEGVIPLTDSQQMALLGEAIGKYITINANITNTMNGRVISKELQRINAENDFAFNR